MKTRLCSLMAVAAIGSTLAVAQDAQNGPAKPMFAVLPAKTLGTPIPGASTPLPTWNGSYVFKGKTYNYNMVGVAPSTNTSATIKTFIIPVKIVITKGANKTTFDPEHVLSNGKTVIQNVVASPIFDKTTDYTLGGIDLGHTQYIDAFQRANFYGSGANPNYHLLLSSPQVAPEQTLSPPAADGITGNPFGNLTTGEVDIDWFDAQIQALLQKFSAKITPDTYPIFVVYDTYLTEFGGCCVGGYHSAFTDTLGTQAYAMFAYIDVVGDFSQDVSALSHETGEWANDPLIAGPNGNQTPCGILEVGDPLEGETNPPFGGFPYTVNGFTYHLQDMVFLPYFDAPKSTSILGWLSFQNNTSISPCSNGS